MSNEHILVVDDNPTNLKLASDLLEWAGCRVSQAVDAESVLAAIQAARPQLILMDIGLPGLDGLTLARKLKSDEATRGIIIIALTAFAMKGDEERTREAGCDGYISKPIDTRAFPAQVEEYLRKGIAL